MYDTQRSLLFEQVDHVSKVDAQGSGIEPILKEIESVARKAKAMSVFSISEDTLDSELHVELLKKSIDMGVMAAIHKNRGVPTGKAPDDLLLFFVSREESCRIHAYLSMQRAFRDYEWSDGAEFLQSNLLGYSESEATSWINTHKRKRIGWLGPTCYFLVSHAQRKAIGRLANRCIDPSSIVEDIEVFFCTDNLLPKETAHQLVPDGMDLCRASIKFDFFKRLFARDINSGRKAAFFVSAINSGNADDLNESLRSNFQFFGG